MARFGEDHPIDLIRGMNKPSRGQVTKMLAKRAAYLTNQITRLTHQHGWPSVRSSMQVAELTTLGRIVEWLEAGELVPAFPREEKEPDEENT